MAVVICRVVEVVAQQGGGWTALTRRTGLPRHVIQRLRRADANPSLLVAQRVAHALDVTIETLWQVRP